MATVRTLPSEGNQSWYPHYADMDGAIRELLGKFGVDQKLLATMLPAIAINDIFPVNSQGAMLALTAQRGDMAIRTDMTPNGWFVLASDAPGNLADWKPVTSAIDSTGLVVKPSNTTGGNTVIRIAPDGTVSLIPEATFATDASVDSKIAAAVADLGEASLEAPDADGYVYAGTVGGDVIRWSAELVSSGSSGGGGGDGSDWLDYFKYVWKNDGLPAESLGIGGGGTEGYASMANFWTASKGGVNLDLSATSGHNVSVTPTPLWAAAPGWPAGYKTEYAFAHNLQPNGSILPETFDVGNVPNGRPVIFIVMSMIWAGAGNPDQAQRIITLGNLGLDYYTGNGAAVGAVGGPRFFWPGGEVLIDPDGYGTTAIIGKPASESGTPNGIVGRIVLEVVCNGPTSKLRINGVDVATMDLSALSPSNAFYTLGVADQPWRGQCAYADIYVSPGVNASNVQITDAHITAARTALMTGVGAA